MADIHRRKTVTVRIGNGAGVVRVGSDGAISTTLTEAAMESDCGEVTQLLRRWRTGDAEVEARLFELLTPD